MAAASLLAAVQSIEDDRQQRRKHHEPQRYHWHYRARDYHSRGHILHARDG
jgi:hypothetical protein